MPSQLIYEKGSTKWPKAAKFDDTQALFVDITVINEESKAIVSPHQSVVREK
jgi:hypothetical protein